MRMLVENNSSTNINIPAYYKALWVTIKLDGREDHLVSWRIISLVGQKLWLFKKNLIKNPSPKNSKDLLKLITPPNVLKEGKSQWCTK